MSGPIVLGKGKSVITAIVGGDMLRWKYEMDTDSFFMTLTSRVWGIVFSIIFNVFNGFLQARVEENNERIQTYLLRQDALMKRPAQATFKE